MADDNNLKGFCSDSKQGDESNDGGLFFFEDQQEVSNSHHHHQQVSMSSNTQELPSSTTDGYVDDSAGWDDWDASDTPSYAFASFYIDTSVGTAQFTSGQLQGTIILDAMNMFSDEDHESGEDEEEQPSYEALLALQERLGRVSIGLSEEIISGCLKTRTHVISRDEEEGEICVVCQGEYEENELVGTLLCDHEYHANCIKIWLLQSNNCPVCKATALKVD